MNIFNLNEQNTVLQEAKNLADKNRITLDMLKRNVEDAFNTLWHNPNATPQEILDVYGTSAAQLFIACRATFDFIKSVDDTYIEPIPPKSVMIHEDGTVKVNE
jgi:hypothetical protein